MNIRVAVNRDNEKFSFIRIMIIEEKQM